MPARPPRTPATGPVRTAPPTAHPGGRPGAAAGRGLLVLLLPATRAQAAPRPALAGQDRHRLQHRELRHPRSNAVDGNTGTRWSSANSDPQWLQVDLGAPAALSSVTLQWEAAYAKGYQIQLSTDGATWTTAYTTANGAGGTETVPVTGTARYVRLYGTVRATGYGLLALGVPGLRRRRRRQPGLRHRQRRPGQDRHLPPAPRTTAPRVQRRRRRREHPLVLGEFRPAVAPGRPRLRAERLRHRGEVGEPPTPRRTASSCPPTAPPGPTPTPPPTAPAAPRPERLRHRPLRPAVRHRPGHRLRLLRLGVPGLQPPAAAPPARPATRRPATPPTSPPPTGTTPPGNWTNRVQRRLRGRQRRRPLRANWTVRTGTSEPGGAAKWGTGEVQTDTANPANVSLDGNHHLNLTAVRDGAGNWTSGRVESRLRRPRRRTAADSPRRSSSPASPTPPATGRPSAPSAPTTAAAAGPPPARPTSSRTSTPQPDLRHPALRHRPRRQLQRVQRHDQRTRLLPGCQSD